MTIRTWENSNTLPVIPVGETASIFNEKVPHAVVQHSTRTVHSQIPPYQHFVQVAMASQMCYNIVQ